MHLFHQTCWFSFHIFFSKQKQVSNFIENAGDAIFKQASGEGASSEKIQEASEAVFGTAVNVIRSVDQSKNDEQVHYERAIRKGLISQGYESEADEIRYMTKSLEGGMYGSESKAAPEEVR